MAPAPIGGRVVVWPPAGDLSRKAPGGARAGRRGRLGVRAAATGPTPPQRQRAAGPQAAPCRSSPTGSGRQAPHDRGGRGPVCGTLADMQFRRPGLVAALFLAAPVACGRPPPEAISAPVLGQDANPTACGGWWRRCRRRTTPSPASATAPCRSTTAAPRAAVAPRPPPPALHEQMAGRLAAQIRADVGW